MRSFKTEIRYFILASLLLLGSQNSVHASGFALIEMNASGQGNAYAGAAVGTNDASTIFFNPAGMMNLEKDQLVVAAHYIAPSSDFNNDGSSLAPVLGGGPLIGDDDDGGSSAFVPNLYWVKTINDDTKFGLGVNAPFGLATEYDDDWVGRYHGILSEVKTLNFNPSIGYRVNDKLSVGGGISLMLVSAELSSAVDFGAICVAGLGPGACAGAGTGPQLDDALAELEADNGSDISTGFNLGLVYHISKQTKIGVTYRSEVDVEVSGDAEFTYPTNATAVAVATSTGAFVDSDIDVDVTLPDSFSISLSHQVDKITYLADVTRTGWSSFDELRIVYDNPAQPDTVTTEDWDDSWRYSFGIDYQYSDKLVLRTGIALDETPVPNAERRTVRLPGDERTWLSFGLTYMVDNTITIDVGYSHLFVEDAKIDNGLESGIPTLEAQLVGEYEADVDILSVQLNWNIE
jgi:long-chain fatty acid transport protein